MVDMKSARKRKRLYVRVYNDVAKDVGTGPATLYGFLEFLSKRFKKDEHGYFCVFNTFIREQLGFGCDKLRNYRNKLIRAGYIDYIQGINQNAKSRYKIVL